MTRSYKPYPKLKREDQEVATQCSINRSLAMVIELGLLDLGNPKRIISNEGYQMRSRRLGPRGPSRGAVASVSEQERGLAIPKEGKGAGAAAAGDG